MPQAPQPAFQQLYDQWGNPVGQPVPVQHQPQQQPVYVQPQQQLPPSYAPQPIQGYEQNMPLGPDGRPVQIWNPALMDGRNYRPKKGTAKFYEKNFRETCPSCGSDHYFKRSEAQDFATCFDCGYPLEQMGSGVGVMTDVRGPVHASHQVSTTDNYQPQVVIGRVS
jgi:hypothetical protein